MSTIQPHDGESEAFRPAGRYRAFADDDGLPLPGYHIDQPPEYEQLTRPVTALRPEPVPVVPLPPVAPFPAPPIPGALAVPPAPVSSGPERRRMNSAWIVYAALTFAGVVMAGTLGFLGIRAISRGETPDSAAIAAATSATPTLVIPTFDPASGATVPQAANVLIGVNQGTPAPAVGLDLRAWDGQERFNILLLGLDRRPGSQGSAFRTDSMILVSFDPSATTVGILSIPRDLYIEIPANTVVGNNYGLQRVNTAYYLGELAQPGAGPQLAMQTVQYNLGIWVHDYVVYDFEAITLLIDAVGGVDITVAETISDPLYPDMYGGYDPLYMRAGLQHMDGALALKYARTRHGSSDIHRARRQQEVIMALRDRILSQNMIPDLLLRAPSLWAQLDRHLKSGLSLDQIIRLLLYAKDIPPGSIRQDVIDYRYVQSVMWNGASVLIPNRDAIGPLLVQVFGADYNR